MVDIKFHCDEETNFRHGFSARAFTYTDYSIEMHNHDFYEVNIVLAGKGIHCIEKSSFCIVPGDVFVISPMVAHAYKNTENLEVYHILLKKEFIEQNKSESKDVTGFLQFTEIEPFLRNNSSNKFFLHLSTLQLMQLKNELKFIDDKGLFSWKECSSMKYHCILKLMYWFSYLLDEQLRNKSRFSETKYEIQIMDVLKYMHMHYSEKITIDVLCEVAFMSRSTFLRTFKNLCNISPIEYLNNYRCEKAREMLLNGKHSKTTVAHSTGFYDLSHMKRMLKKYVSHSTEKTVSVNND